MSQSSPRSLERLHQLDGLRAVAILLVIAHHTVTSPVNKWLVAHDLSYVGALLSSLTSSGVELFFVLSGVVLLRRYTRFNKPFNPRRYFRRRMERLWPPYLVALVLTSLVLLAGALAPTWYSAQVMAAPTVVDGLGHLAIVTFTDAVWNIAWWSLEIEVVFYGVAPFVAMALVRLPDRGHIAPLLVVTASVALAELSAHLGGDLHDRHVLTNFVAFLPCFMLGSLMSKYDGPGRLGAGLTGIGLLWVLLAPVTVVHPQTGFGLFWSGLMMLALQPTGWLRQFLSGHLWVWIGERTYSLFLTHMTVLTLTNYLLSFVLPERNMVYFALSRGLGLTLSLLVAMAVFQLVETRFARGLVTADQIWPWSRKRLKDTN